MTPPNLTTFITLKRSEGFHIFEESRRRHTKYRILSPCGTTFTWILPTTPSDHRAWRNALADFSRALVRARTLRTSKEAFP